MARFIFSAFADEAASDINGQIAALKDNGISYIEPRNVDGTPILKLSNEKLYEIRAALDKASIKVGSLGSPIGKYPINEPFDIHMKELERALEVCEILGTTNMRMFSFFVEQDELSEKRDEVIYRLEKMCLLAKEHGVRLCHENESKIYGQMPREVYDLYNSVPMLYFIFDAANYRMNDGDVIDGAKATLLRPAYMHIKDAIFSSQQIVPAGEGEGQIGEVIDMFNEATDGLVYLTLEPHLHIFDAYKDIDEHELKGKYNFKTNREAFDFAVRALEKLMTEKGYRKEDNGEWIK